MSRRKPPKRRRADTLSDAPVLPVETPGPYNPLDKLNLAKSVAESLLAKPLGPVQPASRFLGAGIYAIYYAGKFKPYQPISGTDTPIYVGKAVPTGSRRGGMGLDVGAGAVLFNRLAEHAESITQVENLRLGDFQCRSLVVDDIWIPLGESLMIQNYQPVWNKVVPGFGNHDPGSGRKGQRRSEWDTIHKGRPWVANLGNPSRLSEAEILNKIADFFAGRKVELTDERDQVSEEE